MGFDKTQMAADLKTLFESDPATREAGANGVADAVVDNYTGDAEGGTISQVAYWDTADTIAGDADFTFDSSNNRLNVPEIWFQSGSTNGTGPYIGFNAYYDGGWKFRDDSGYCGVIRFDRTIGTLQFYTDDNQSTAEGSAASPTIKLAIDKDGKVGIGTSSPAYTLEINATGNAGFNIHSTTAGEDCRLEIGTGGSGNRDARIDLVGDDTYPDYGLRLLRTNGGANADSYLLHRGTGTFYISALDGGSVQLGTSSTTRLNILAGGNVGINCTPGYKFEVDDNIANYMTRFYNAGNTNSRYGIRVDCGKTDQSGINYYFRAGAGDGTTAAGWLEVIAGVFQLVDASDETLKEEVADTQVNGLDVINKIHCKEFKFKKNDYKHPIGFVAQDLLGAFPEAVCPSEGILGVSRTALIPVLVKAIQEQQDELEDLKAQISSLIAKVGI